MRLLSWALWVLMMFLIFAAAKTHSEAALLAAAVCLVAGSFADARRSAL
jgi:hypothetical protein